MKANLFFSGLIGSGKTCISRLVASELGFRWNSFGTVLKKIATERGVPTTRSSLQALGAEVVATQSEALCQRVIAEAYPLGSEPVVIDGVRHKRIRDELRRLLLPQESLLIYVDVPETARIERLRLRNDLIIADVHKLQEHSTETQVAQSIREMSDYVADNSRELATTVQAILTWLERR